MLRLENSIWLSLADFMLVMREERSIREASESVISSNPRVLAAISGSFRASGSGAGLYLSISLTDPPASLVLALLGRTSFSFFSDWRPLLEGALTVLSILGEASTLAASRFNSANSASLWRMFSNRISSYSLNPGFVFTYFFSSLTFISGFTSTSFISIVFGEASISLVFDLRARFGTISSRTLLVLSLKACLLEPGLRTQVS